LILSFHKSSSFFFSWHQPPWVVVLTPKWFSDVICLKMHYFFFFGGKIRLEMMIFDRFSIMGDRENFADDRQFWVVLIFNFHGTCWQSLKTSFFLALLFFLSIITMVIVFCLKNTPASSQIEFVWFLASVDFFCQLAGRVLRCFILIFDNEVLSTSFFLIYDTKTVLTLFLF